jgi:hypothetical protein
MISRILTTVAFAVTFSVAFGFADVWIGVVVRIGVVVFLGDDVTVVVGDGVVDVDDVAAGIVLVFFVSSGTTSHDSLSPCSGVSQHASSTSLKQHQHCLLLSTAERRGDGAKGAAV